MLRILHPHKGSLASRGGSLVNRGAKGAFTMAIADNPMIQSPEIKTKFKILHAVDRPIDELSVKDICAKAGVSRDTFYRHFDSKYDISVWHGKLAQSMYLDQAGRTTDFRTGYYHDFRLLAEERDFYICAYKNMGKSTNEFPLMNEHRKNVLLETLVDWHKVTMDDDLEFCLDAFVMLETVLVTRWLRAGCDPDPDVFAERMMTVIPSRLYEALEG